MLYIKICMQAGETSLASTMRPVLGYSPPTTGPLRTDPSVATQDIFRVPPISIQFLGSSVSPHARELRQ